MSQQQQRDGDSPRANTRKKIIEQAQLNCYEARSQCLRAKSRYGVVPRDFRLHFQDTILDYYWALRPLQDDSAVEDWWDKVTLSTEWEHVAEREDRRAAESFDPQQEHRGGSTETEPVEGIDNLADISEMVETITKERSTLRGEEVTSTTRQKVLAFSVLADISAVLDEAAGRLGFNPETPEQDRPFTDWGDDFDYSEEVDHGIQE